MRHDGRRRILVLLLLLGHVVVPRIWAQYANPYENEANDNYGTVVAADLAVGAPDENVGFLIDAGAVSIFHGSTSGLTNAQFRLSPEPGAWDEFGRALAAGDFGKSAPADLAVGIPREDFNVYPSTVANAGAVRVIYGDPAGLDVSSQLWFQPFKWSW